jgi:hypothetical protein
MNIVVSMGFIDPQSGDRVIIYNDRFVVRFKAKLLEPEHPWMVLISSSLDWRQWLATEGKDLVSYVASPGEVEYGKQTLMRAYRECLELLGILV